MKTEYDIQIYTGKQYGWEVVATETDRKQANRCRNEYQQNGSEPVRIRRVQVEEVESNQDKFIIGINNATAHLR